MDETEEKRFDLAVAIKASQRINNAMKLIEEYETSDEVLIRGLERLIIQEKTKNHARLSNMEASAGELYQELKSRQLGKGAGAKGDDYPSTSATALRGSNTPKEGELPANPAPPKEVCPMTGKEHRMGNKWCLDCGELKNWV